MTELLCVGDRVLWRGGFGTDEARLQRVVAIELCSTPRSKYGQRVAEVEWHLAEYLNVTLDNGRWAYGDQIEPYDVALEFEAAVWRCPRAAWSAVLDALRAWAVEDEGFDADRIHIDLLGNPGRPTACTTRLVRRERAWPAGAEARLRTRVAPLGGDDVRIVATYR